MSFTVVLHGDPNAPHQARLGAALAARGHRILVAEAPTVITKLRDEYGVQSEPLHVATKGPRWARLLRLWRAVRAQRVDVVHLNYVRPMHTLWADLPGGMPYVATAWGSDINEEVFRHAPAHVRAVDRVLSRAGAISADSEQLLSRARARACSDAPAELVLWGADRETFDRARAASDTARWREELGIAAFQRVLLSPRQPQAHYHVDRILRAFAASRFRADGVLVIKCHGRAEEASYVADLETLARTLGVHERVRFAPPCPYARLPGLYALADAAVSAPEADGWPATFCELAALGVPIIATDLPAYATLLEHGRNALLVRPGEEASLVAALNRLLDEPLLREHLAAEGLSFARDRGDWHRCVDRFEVLYQAAIAGHAAAVRRGSLLTRAFSALGSPSARSKHVAPR